MPGSSRKRKTFQMIPGPVRDADRADIDRWRGLTVTGVARIFVRMLSSIRFLVTFLLGFVVAWLGPSFVHQVSPLFSTKTANPSAAKMAATLPLKFLTVAPVAKHTATVIFVHVCIS